MSIKPVAVWRVDDECHLHSTQIEPPSALNRGVALVIAAVLAIVGGMLLKALLKALLVAGGLRRKARG